MRCYRCGCDNSETIQTCPGCGFALKSGLGALAAASPFGIGPDQVISPVVAAIEPALGYATMGERFLAFLCDASIEAVLVSSFLAFYAESSLDSEFLKWFVPWAIPWTYMTLCEVLFHRTAGKWLMRIQLRSDSEEPAYPSFFRILVRESIGKFISGMILGIGFLAGGWNNKHKTWADGMAKTVVVRTGMVSGRLKVFLAPVLICANLGISFALTEAAQRYETSVVQQVEATEIKAESVHVQIFQSLFRPAPRSTTEYQRMVAPLPSMLDEYSRLLTDEQDLVWKTTKLPKVTESMKFHGQIYKQVIVLRQEIAALVREHVEMVQKFDPLRQTWKELLQDRERILDEINWRNDRINEVGKIFLPQKYTFVHQGSDDR